VRKQLSTSFKYNSIVKRKVLSLQWEFTFEETLIWGEPSYLAKKGSIIHIDSKVENPDQYAL